MSAPRLWVWVGSPDDKLDVVRYVTATEVDMLTQPCVQAALTAERNLRTREWGRANEAERMLAANEGRVREIVDEVLRLRVEALESVLRRCRRAVEDCADLIGSACPDASTWTDGLAGEADAALAEAADLLDSKDEPCRGT